YLIERDGFGHGVGGFKHTRQFHAEFGGCTGGAERQSMVAQKRRQPSGVTRGSGRGIVGQDSLPKSIIRAENGTGVHGDSGQGRAASRRAGGADRRPPKTPSARPGS